MTENAPQFFIGDKLGEDAGITLKWINDEKISLFAYNHVLNSSHDAPSKFANSTNAVNVHHLTVESILEEHSIRNLVNECASIFVNLQTVKATASSTDFLKISQTYRSVIRACLEKIRDVVENEEGEQIDVEKYQHFSTVFYSIECVWHLCELLLIDQSSQNAVVPNLLEWVKFHFPAAERMALDFLTQGRIIDSYAEFWPTVKGLVLQGEINTARQLLKLHLSSEKTTFQLADQILKTMPTYSIYGGLSLQKFKSQRQYWAANNDAKVQAGILAAEPQLEEIIKLVIGDKETWIEQCKASKDWYEYFPGYLYFTEPGCKLFELSGYANNWLSQWIRSKHSDVGQIRILDKIILNVMEHNMHQFLHDIQNMSDNKWFVVHLTDLLYHCGQLKLSADESEKSEQFRESLIYDFGLTLMSKGSMWQIGLDYLKYSCTEGLGARELLIARVPIKNEKCAMKIIAYAKKNEFPNVESEVCRVMVQRNMANQRYGNALEWAIRSRDNVYVTAVADIFLEHYCQTGNMMCEDILANVGGKMFISPRLVFLVKYYDFHRYYREREFAQAGELLISLLDSKIIPEFFWSRLLADTIPLLEFKEPIIPSKETFIILHHLEANWLPLLEKKKNSKITNEKVLDSRTSDDSNLISLLRLACARNLSRAFIIEKSLAM